MNNKYIHYAYYFIVELYEFYIVSVTRAPSLKISMVYIEIIHMPLK